MIGRAGTRVRRALPRRLAEAMREPRADTGWVQTSLVQERPVATPPVDRDGLLADLLALRLVALNDGRVEPRARVDLIGGLVVASDLRSARFARDFVVGPGPASFTLARHVRPHRNGRLLDLGCGSGIQGLLSGARRTDVVAVDINPRALAFTACNADLNGRSHVRTMLGDFLATEPDRDFDGRFATVIANPPFVLAPTHELTYRDRTLPRDETGARTVERVARALAPGGRGYVLCNWIDGEADWAEPARGWIASTGLDGVAIRIASLDAATYAMTWSRDLGPAERQVRVASWAAALAAENIRAIHIGVIAIARNRSRARRPRFAGWDSAREPERWRRVEQVLVG